MSEMSEKDRISTAYNSFMNAMDMIPGYRAYRRTVQDLLNRAHGKEGTYNPTEFARDLGYSTVPFYTAYDNWLYDRPQNWQQNMIDAATVAIPTAAAGTKVLNQVVKNPKAGFARNPIEYNKLTPKDQALVDRAIEDWNAQVAARGLNPRPQKVPYFQEFADENLNENMWDLIDKFQLYPVVRGKLEGNLKTKAILPENTADAGFLRHRLSNYDYVTNSGKEQLEKDMMRTGTLPKYDKKYYDYEGHYAKVFPTAEGGKTDLGSNIKSQVLESLEGKFPGYIEALEGRGPRQPVNKKYSLNYETVPGYFDSVIRDFNNIPSKDVKDFYRTYIDDADYHIRTLQQTLGYYNETPESRTLFKDRIANQMDELKQWQKFRMELDNAYTIRSLNEL